MNYKDMFTFKSEDSHEKDIYFLEDFDYLLALNKSEQISFEDDFYLKVFLKKLLFELPSLEINDFLQIQFENSEHPEVFCDFVFLEVIPAIQTIIKNAMISGNGIEYYKAEKLEGEFIISENVIKNRNYDFRLFYHQAAMFEYVPKFKRIIKILKKLTKQNDKNINNGQIITWKASPNVLGYLVSELASKGYLKTPIYQGKTNNSELTRQVLKSFKFTCKTPSFDGLKPYVIRGSSQNEDLDYKLRNLGWDIPKYDDDSK
ncbi:hypothetical protein BTO05_10930 [Winogradskyella sp. PC-19]|uniref:hypothetical protein n=1 Tax=Winogradskyella sp. PC-19 TaxID=754417 RepID=UPI000B3D06C9|nr:hypothetical protein [Winogradskyella sp. PC-19]ARV10124.1 hypothetical protein BTO05_10930 [Winogradskyella sp. PC-19]RZN74449.1 MAG: hypothetical protein EVB12_08335 [Winogradskyella sp.]